MIKSILLITSLFLTSAHADETAKKCPNDFGMGDGTPNIVYKANKQLNVVVCGNVADESKHQYQGFEIASQDAKGNFNKIFIGGETQQYIVNTNRSGVYLEEMAYTADTWIPVFKSAIQCTQKSCSKSKDNCIFKKPAPIKQLSALNEYHSYISGNLKDQAPDESLIQRLGDLALTGNADAQKVFLNSSGLKLDGASSETYSEISGLLKRLSQAKCL